MKQFFTLLIAVLFTLLFTHCERDVIENESDCADVHWSYSGESGPEHWPDLCAAFSACGHAKQSPVDIVNPTEGSNLGPVNFNYETTRVSIENNGHTIQFTCDPGNTIRINETNYELLQFHYHGLSEHTVEGEYYPLEVHFVHRASDQDFAVIGVFYEIGDENPLFTDFLAHFPMEEEKFEDHNTEIDLMALLPDNKSYYHYSGSLTTPPCTEVVNWYVLKTPVTASQEQLSYFQDILQNNYRPVQDLNDRSILVYQE